MLSTIIVFSNGSEQLAIQMIGAQKLELSYTVLLKNF